MRALIVDDEPPARRALASLLAAMDGVELAGTAGDGLEALAVIAGEPIDLLLTDIAMPLLAGLELVERLAASCAQPAVVFVTAYVEHAVRAFELGAADYLLKPVSPERLSLAIERARGGRPPAQRALWRGVVGLRGATAAPDHLWADVRGGRRRVPLDQIELIRAEGDYVRLFAQAGSYLAPGPLDRLAAQLAGAGFLRVHRSAIVRLDAVREVRTDATRRLVLIMNGGERVVAGRRRAPAVRALLTRP
ncbi:LytTR family DNA-binding domain-containing protein [Sphingomonas sp.]|uniref:LytR/AlgR family response regulator transcription factor n=1 Tax=Sphingomonas sp. TaxID=28214 RepID=UPI002DBA7C84|nr:LytTR family DNA-binding domain-containing protein [Sphingomonas sp.]